MSFTASQSLLKLMSIESVLPSNHLILCHPFVFPSIFPASGSNELASFSLSISTSNECSGLISFRIDWFDLLVVQGDSQESSPKPQFESINYSAFSLLYGPTFISISDYWKNHSVDYMDLCWQSIEPHRVLHLVQEQDFREYLLNALDVIDSACS